MSEESETPPKPRPDAEILMEFENALYHVECSSSVRALARIGVELLLDIRRGRPEPPKPRTVCSICKSAPGIRTVRFTPGVLEPLPSSPIRMAGTYWFCQSCARATLPPTQYDALFAPRAPVTP